MVHIRYDAAIIKTFATRLYERARAIVVIMAVVGGLVGASTAGAGGAVLGHGWLGALFGLAVGGVVGYLVGQHMAFGLKLQAQVALCQVQIEENTRAGAASQRSPAPPAVPGRPANTNAA
jgi:hypothetical protein